MPDSFAEIGQDVFCGDELSVFTSSSSYSGKKRQK